jgi:hypothetical protein
MVPETPLSEIRLDKDSSLLCLKIISSQFSSFRSGTGVPLLSGAWDAGALTAM